MTPLFVLRGFAVAALGSTLLAACGGGGDGGTAATTVTPGSTAVAQSTNEGTGGRKTLVVDVDGVSHETMRQLLASRRVPALASLTIAPAWTGGRNGTLSEQRTSAGPGWASLVTGAWANRHGVRWDSDDQRIDVDATPTLFTLARRQSAAMKTAAVTSNSAFQAMVSSDAASGAITTAVDCAGADRCVTDRSNAMLRSGYDLVVAQYGAPAAAVDAGQMGDSHYQAVLDDTAAAIGTLLATIAQRQANDATEDWLVLLTTGYGHDAFGRATGLQATSSKTIFIASNKTLPGLPGVGTVAPTDDRLLALAASTDIAPTVLRQMGVVTPAIDARFNGMPLQATPAVRQLDARTGSDKASIVLSWQLAGASTAPVQLLRDGVPIARLAADATGYTDAIQATKSDTYTFRYTVVAGDTAVSLDARIAYVKPVQPAALAATLVNGLANYYPLDALPATDVRNASTLAPWASDADGGKLVGDDGFAAPLNARALRVDSTVKNASGFAGYRLLQTSDVATDPAVTAFTIGFWLRTDASCSQGVSNGASVIANKNYTTGSNAGLAIGLFASCEIRFNVGTGSARADSNGYSLSAGQWAYVAMVVDKAKLSMTGYVMDPVNGVQTKSAALTSALVAKLGGLNNGLDLNEDGTGQYYLRETSSPRGAMDFNDLAIWSRALTTDELTSLFKAAKPLGSLNP